MSWNLSCPDWWERMQAGRSLVPDLPLDLVAGNRAVAVKADEQYAAFECEGHVLWVAEKLAETFAKII